MSYLRVKWIKGHPYLYEQASYRVGDKVKTKHIRYVGNFGFVGGGHGGGFPFAEHISQKRKKDIDGQIARVYLNNQHPYEREILRRCLYPHKFPLLIGVKEAPDLQGASGYVERTKTTPTKVTAFALRAESAPFTCMHELGHVFEFGDHIIDDEIDTLRTEFIDQVHQSLTAAVLGDLAEKEAFIKQYAPLIDIREDFHTQPVKVKSLKDRDIYQMLEDVKAGVVHKTIFDMEFLYWTHPDYRLEKPQEIFADAVSSLIIDPKRAFEAHTPTGRKFLSKVYVKLYKHLEEKYSISLDRPKESKQGK